MYMLLDDYGALQDQTEQVLGQNWKFCTSDPKNHAISEIYANSEILRNVPRSRGAISAALWFGQHVFGLLVHPGAVVHSVVFLSSFYNFITLKQHLGNAHNIKRFLK
jgi:hypothetical protein